MRLDVSTKVLPEYDQVTHQETLEVVSYWVTMSELPLGLAQASPALEVFVTCRAREFPTTVGYA